MENSVDSKEIAEGNVDWTTVGWFEEGDGDFTDEELHGLARWGCFVPQTVEFWA